MLLEDKTVQVVGILLQADFTISFTNIRSTACKYIFLPMAHITWLSTSLVHVAPLAFTVVGVWGK
jgi:hypothetical protein